jgi:hypothetical protein
VPRAFGDTEKPWQDPSMIMVMRIIVVPVISEVSVMFSLWWMLLTTRSQSVCALPRWDA